LLKIEVLNLMGNIDKCSRLRILEDQTFQHTGKVVFVAKVCGEGYDFHLFTNTFQEQPILQIA